MSWLDNLPAVFHGWRAWQATAEAQINVFCCRGGSTGPLALIAAGVHGDEYEGPAALFALAQALSTHHVQGTVVLAPVVNPVAFAAGTRLHPEDGCNLARTFPGNAYGGPTERLAAAIFGELAARADYLIDLHSGGVEYVFHPVTGFYGPPRTDNPSFQAARTFGLPMLWQLPPTEGVLSCEAWKRGKIAIGAEYCGAGQLSAAGVRDYRNGIAACLALWGLLDSKPEPPGPSVVFEGDWELASDEGIFIAHCRLGESVTQGKTLAAILGPRGESRQEFVSPCDGVILGLRSKAYIRPGNWAILIGKRMETDV